MSLRSLGFSHPDFLSLTWPELYLRFCLAWRAAQAQDAK